jgi:hypothetical protein
MEPALKHTEYEIIVARDGTYTAIRKYLRGQPNKKAMLCNSRRRNDPTKARLRFP